MHLVVVLLLQAVLVVPSRPEGAAVAAATHAGVGQALTVLHGWDERRARAWATGDEQALRALYVPGSAAARADLRLLRSYSARGLVVRRLVTQVFGVRLLHLSPGRLVVRVLDRVAGGEVATPDGTQPLSSSRPAVRRIVLGRYAGAWRVAAVTR